MGKILIFLEIARKKRKERMEKRTDGEKNGV
jgi:hypothetical protein